MYSAILPGAERHNKKGPDYYPGLLRLTSVLISHRQAVHKR